MPPTPLLDRLVGLITWLTDRLVGPKAQAGYAQAYPGNDRVGLDAARTGTLLARLRDIVARFRAVAATPIPPPKPAAQPPEPRFIPTHVLTFHPEEPAPEPPPPPLVLPRAWRWLLGVAPHLIPGRTLFEDILRDADTQAALAADYRLGPILRPLAWMLGVDRKLVPASSRRPRLAVLVCGGRKELAEAIAEYTAARAVAGFDIRTLCYKQPTIGRPRRAIWRGKNGFVLPEGVDLWH